MTRRWQSVVAAALVAGLGLTVAPAPAQAAPVFDNADTYLQTSAGGGLDGADCSSQTTTPPPVDQLPVAENGAATTRTFTSSDTIKHLSTPVGTRSMTLSAGAAVTSVAGLPSTIDLTTTAQGQVQITGTDCTANYNTSATLTFRFVLPLGAILHFTSSATPGTSGQLRVHDIHAPTSDLGVSYDSFLYGAQDDLRVFLPAGTYDGTMRGLTDIESSQHTGSGTFSGHATFTLAGGQTSPPSGKAGHYLTLPGSVSCATGQLTSTVTDRKARAHRVHAVTFFVNGHKAKKVKHPKKGEAVVLPVAGDQPTELRAVVVLAAKRAGHRAKPLEVVATYEACS